MTHIFRIALAATLVLALGCGGETAESIRDETRAAIGDLTTTLQGVVDEESAKAAKAKLEAFRARIDAIEARENTLSNAERQKLLGMRDELQREMFLAMQTEMQRIMADGTLSQHLTTVLLELSQDTR